MIQPTDTAESPAVLIVDDDPDLCCALQDLLAFDGYHVDISVTGAQALAAAQASHYDAVILDIGLPDMDGIAVLLALQNLDAKLPVVILTAYTKEEDTVGALKKGAFAYLLKPYNSDELKAVLRRAIGVKETMD
jgi:DNA-binding response OmpR family regulator